MKEPKTQPRYDTEQEILDAIEAARQRAVKAEEQALEFDELKSNAAKAAVEADELGGQGSGEFWRDQMMKFKSKAKKCRTRSRRINDITLKKLKDVMAEFRTETMHFMAGDGSIPR
jgi:hypothetical protein